MQQDQPITDALLDRLVDGELPPDEERQLLSALEAAPGQWRRCALAFIEAQTWRRELAAMTVKGGRSLKESRLAGAAGATNPPSSEATRQPAPPARRRAARSYSALALAASVLIAFATGWLVPRAWRGGDVQTGPIVAGGFDERPSAPEAEQPFWPGVIDPNHVMMVVETRPDGSERPLLVPLLEERDANRLAGGIAEAGISSVLPDSVRRQLEQAGYRIQQKRRYAPLALESGERLIVPVEDTQIVPVRAGVY